MTSPNAHDQPNEPPRTPQQHSPAESSLPIEPIDQQAIGTWLDRLAANTPAPGGGAVAALTAAIGAALGSMVISYTRGKKAFRDQEDELAEAHARLTTIRTMLLNLAAEDADAYARLNALMKLPDDHPDRQTHWADAVRNAIDVPRAGLATCVSLARLLDGLLGRSNQWLASDLAIAAALAAAGARAFSFNVIVNLPQLDDIADQQDLLAQTSAMTRTAQELASNITQTVAQSLAGEIQSSSAAAP